MESHKTPLIREANALTPSIPGTIFVAVTKLETGASYARNIFTHKTGHPRI